MAEISFIKTRVYQGRKWVEVLSGGERIGLLVRWYGNKEAKRKPYWYLYDSRKDELSPHVGQIPGDLTDAKRLANKYFTEIAKDV